MYRNVHFPKTIMEVSVAKEAGGEVFWDKPLREARYE